ncbi:hypothetical protein [Streptomyces sp. NPDC059452]|uniref:hypothetical protein n=1 Tax=Streptomyces sp. NPDC059452 TaxID=3346835 RepID=UPI00369AF5C1
MLNTLVGRSRSTQWKIHEERPVHENHWVNLWITDIETPDGNRLVLEETGWRPGPIRPLIYAEPANGITDSQHHLFRADSATYQGPPTEKNESDRIEWIPLTTIRDMINRRDIVSSGTLVGLLYILMDEATS